MLRNVSLAGLILAVGALHPLLLWGGGSGSFLLVTKRCESAGCLHDTSQLFFLRAGRRCGGCRCGVVGGGSHRVSLIASDLRLPEVGFFVCVRLGLALDEWIFYLSSCSDLPSFAYHAP